MRRILLAISTILALATVSACGDDTAPTGNGGMSQNSGEQLMCDEDTLANDRSACESAGCRFLSGDELDPETCAVLSGSTGQCVAPDAEIIPGPVLAVIDETVYRFEDGVVDAAERCDQSNAPGCSCPLN